MFKEAFTSTHFIMSFTFIVFGVITGIIIEKIILEQLKKLSDQKHLEGMEIIVSSLQGMAILWCSILGIYIGIINIPFIPELLDFVKNILIVIFILTVTFFGIRISGGFIHLYARKKAGIFPSTTISKSHHHSILYHNRESLSGRSDHT